MAPTVLARRVRGRERLESSEPTSSGAESIVCPSCSFARGAWSCGPKARSQRMSEAARRNTSSSICGVSLPVNVFCWLG